MIAYKVFYLKKRKLYPFWLKELMEFYDPKYIYQRPLKCGPFACFECLKEAKDFAVGWEVPYRIHRVKIKVSKDICLWNPDWIGGVKQYVKNYHPNTVFADEFEILERVK